MVQLKAQTQKLSHRRNSSSNLMRKIGHEKTADKSDRYRHCRAKHNVLLEPGDRHGNPYSLFRDEEFVEWLMARAVEYLQEESGPGG